MNGTNQGTTQSIPQDMTLDELVLLERRERVNHSCQHLVEPFDELIARIGMDDQYPDRAGSHRAGHRRAAQLLSDHRDESVEGQELVFEGRQSVGPAASPLVGEEELRGEVEQFQVSTLLQLQLEERGDAEPKPHPVSDFPNMLGKGFPNRGREEPVGGRPAYRGEREAIRDRLLLKNRVAAGIRPGLPGGRQDSVGL
jgi:hypothetical protein